MFLYKLEIQGFKSFCDKTLLNFGDGITGVIGPNGCGKTNVSDAIRWVLGEQSAKQLRGDSMEDVIFNGCPTRKPLGMAEVHLTFKNDRGILPTEFSEVTISRRVFRSGMSEYFLNKTPCRLKDIKDLFFDTGMGSHAYSVIERQMVDNILSDNTNHRRFLFEEASGITKYKQRKTEALNKLDQTEGDLTRLNDIVFEIERELRSLARQVGKARRYQRLRDDVRDLDLALTADLITKLKEREAKAKEEWQEESVRREGVATELDTIEAQLNDQKLALLELERELTTAQGGLKDREEARVAAEHQVVLLRERATGLTRRAEEATDEAARMRERLIETQGREQEAQERLAEAREMRETAQGDSETNEASLNLLEQDLRATRAHAATHKQLSLDLFSTEAEKKGLCERYRERQIALGERRADAELRRNDQLERASFLERSLVEGTERRTQLEAEVESARAELAAGEDAITAANDRISAAEAALSQLKQQAAAADSRLRTLLELKKNFEGVSEGVKALLAAEASLPGMLGVVADVLEVPSEYLDALEASLGEASAFVLVENREAIEPALGRLRSLESGRATLVDLSALTASPRIDGPQHAGVLGRASDLVKCDERFRPLVDRLLGTVFVVESREVAAELAHLSMGGMRFVSLDGEVWERGRVRAGSGKSTGGLLHREMEIRDLSGKLADLSLAIEGATTEREQLDEARALAIETRDQARWMLDETKTALESQVRELSGVDRERGIALKDAEDRVKEMETHDIELEALARSLAEAEAELASFQSELDAVRAQLAEADIEVKAKEMARDEAAAKAQASREALLRYSREASEWETTWARAEQTVRELESAIKHREEEASQHSGRIAEIEAEVAGLSAGLTGLLESEGSQRERVLELQKVHIGLKEQVQAGEDAARQRRFEVTELGERLHMLELDRVQARADLDRTFERLRTEYEIDPEQWQPQPLPEGVDAETAPRQLEEARTKLRAIGPVNLLALEEYAKKKERFTFLTQQREDLHKAKAQLLEAIEKINVTASQMFSETFAKVHENFKDIFKTLFEGGDCELRMTGEDPMECEVEIVAKPRGKHLQSITLMSSGERSLTAIALLFAIYLVKPSPFCLLDEVDAPLDDANVDRFLNMLRRFGDRTQFVVITHNKKTMEAAGCIYGVTMQELGVSKLVSVNLDGVDVSHESRREAITAAIG
ncbi:MAG: chromosome segregation protein SMC [Candidatus Eisenbacteria bacterium]|uniref:Chromosome partition protein Smc n=1 Tax=Eiseniibacteriota bacterium TaxID=2212470 RepID=A0A933SJK7_UNCEI|nr:chromosome segregation protein SMC [Candidatus Eisenbacteria bacterium]